MNEKRVNAGQGDYGDGRLWEWRRPVGERGNEKDEVRFLVTFREDPPGTVWRMTPVRVDSRHMLHASEYELGPRELDAMNEDDAAWENLVPVLVARLAETERRGSACDE